MAAAAAVVMMLETAAAADDDIPHLEFRYLLDRIHLHYTECAIKLGETISVLPCFGGFACQTLLLLCRQRDSIQ